ncbi:gamma-glutamyl kinase [Actibacterium sp. D379-3]
MMVFWKAGLVFLAVPKTGTQAYTAALGDMADMVVRHPPGLKHMAAQRFRRKLLPVLDPSGTADLRTMAVIRDPLDWLGSWYRYRGRPALNGQPNSTAGLSFDQFVAGYLAAEQPAWAGVGSQFRFVSNGQGKVITDFLFPYEDQDGLRHFLAARLGRDLAPPAEMNRSPDGITVLSPELETRLRSERAEDFALHAAVARGDHRPA